MSCFADRVLALSVYKSLNFGMNPPSMGKITMHTWDFSLLAKIVLSEICGSNPVTSAFRRVYIWLHNQFHHLRSTLSMTLGHVSFGGIRGPVIFWSPPSDLWLLRYEILVAPQTKLFYSPLLNKCPCEQMNNRAPCWVVAAISDSLYSVTRYGRLICRWQVLKLRHTRRLVSRGR